MDKEELRTIEAKERGIPQAHEIARLLEHIDSLETSLVEKHDRILKMSELHATTLRMMAYEKQILEKRVNYLEGVAKRACDELSSSKEGG